MKTKRFTLGLSLLLFSPVITLFSCSKQEEHSGVKASLYGTTLYASYDFEAAYSNASFDVQSNKELLRDWLNKDNLDSYGDVVSYEVIFQSLLKNNKINWSEFEVEGATPKTIEELKKLINSKLPNVANYGKVKFGSEEEKTLTYKNIVYSINQDENATGQIPIDFYIYNFNKIDEGSIGLTSAYNGYATSKNGYFVGEIPSFIISIEGNDPANPILDRSYSLSLPIISDISNALDLYFNICWNIEL